MSDVSTNKIFGLDLRATGSALSFNLTSAALYRYALPLLQTLDTRSGDLVRREGLILLLRDNEDHVGLGEISPLPGFSDESLALALSRTVQILQKMVGSADYLTQFLARGGDWEEMGKPSVANFGIETALLSLLANSNHLDLGSLLFGSSSKRIPVNGLINAELAEWVPLALELVDAGYSTLKIKVGKINSELEAIGVQSIRDAVGPEVNIRLDANRSWSLEEAIQFGKSVRSSDIEFIEEPLSNPVDLPVFYDESGTHFAFDETLHHILDPGISFQSYTGLAALVIKPTLVACVPRILDLIKQAREQGIKVVISSSYETDIGLMNLAQFAAGVSGEEITTGLGTYGLYSKHLSSVSLAPQKGWVSIQSLDVEDLELDSCELVYENHV